MIDVHGCGRGVWSKSVDRQYQNNFANSEQHDLCNTRLLYCSDGNSAHEIDQDGDQGESGSIVAICVIERSVCKESKKIVEQEGSRPRAGEEEDESNGEQEDKDQANGRKSDRVCRATTSNDQLIERQRGQGQQEVIEGNADKVSNGEGDVL